MDPLSGATDLETHTVGNQPGPRGDVDLLATDPALQSVVGGDDVVARVGACWGGAALRDLGRAAQRHPPEVRLFDAGGRRLDEVAFHPAYHRLMTDGIGAGYAAGPWTGGSHVRHAALVYMMSQVEPGVCCPMTMTYAAIPALSGQGARAETWRDTALSLEYDPSVAPLHAKRGATIGMAMTEKQGGSDVRANTTRAERRGDHYRLTGHKWFCSAPMSDAFLSLAQAPGGLTCFLVPRWLETGRNAIRLVRLKDKLGNRANASAEIEYHGALAWRLGEEGDGVRRIIRMVHHTRLDTAVAPAGLMRAGLAEAMHWVTHRSAFQRRLIDQPLMRRVLADLALDWWGATSLAFRAARAFDAPGEAAFARLTVALAKYLNNKLAPRFMAEAMEVLGGMGYVEDTAMPALYREAPLNGIWEGSGNVICLDILRTLSREPEAMDALMAELGAARGLSHAYDSVLKDFAERWPGLPVEADARAFVEEAALLLTAAALSREAPAAVAEAFAGSRLVPQRTRVAGAVSGLDEDAILAAV